MTDNDTRARALRAVEGALLADGPPDTEARILAAIEAAGLAVVDAGELERLRSRAAMWARIPVEGAPDDR